MEKNTYDDFNKCFQNSFEYVFEAMLGLCTSKCDAMKDKSGKMFCSVIGMVGGNKGRVRLEANADTVKKIAENMNGEPVNNIMDVYTCFSELANMVCGNAVTTINNKYRGTEIRLSPPAVFSGENMRIATPSTYSTSNYFSSEYGEILLDIGFEGMC